MAMNLTAFGKRVRNVRKKRGFSQNQLSEILHVSSTYISHLENGSKSLSMDLFVSLVNALDTTADEILCDSLEKRVFYIAGSFSQLLADCNDYEQQVLLEIMTASKQALRNNERIFRRRQ